MASHFPLLSRLLPPSHFFFLLLPWLLISLPNPVIFSFGDSNSDTPDSSRGLASQSTSPMVVPSSADQLAVSPMDASIFSGVGGWLRRKKGGFLLAGDGEEGGFSSSGGQQEGAFLARGGGPADGGRRQWKNKKVELDGSRETVWFIWFTGRTTGLTGLIPVALMFLGSAYSWRQHVFSESDQHEFKHNHEEWINSVKPILDASISSQLHDVLEVADTEIENCQSARMEIRSALNSLLKDDGILVIPTVADPPPKLGGKESLSEEYQNRTLGLLSIASMSGCCQVTVPLGLYDKYPVSVSFMARHGGDRFLLDTVQTMYASLQEQADIAAKSKLSSNAVDRETSAEIAKEKGNQAFKDKQWQKAVGFYTEAIKLSGNNATYYSNRAAAYLEMGSFLQAEADCTKAINLDKKEVYPVNIYMFSGSSLFQNVKAYLRRGTAREMLGYYKDAIEGTNNYGRNTSSKQKMLNDTDFRYALVLEPTNKRASLSADRLKKLFQKMICHTFPAAPQI
ncbi:Translocon at the outer membrane of chloroplasts 64 [Vitis vinifera]|uniref:Translocon at the outer membrane of chloroplasts 64 n=1 Tax=Vitis vinifera TaxID=29760 RepID=A0A438KA73_VITVI|nr:Translocon at the outer membrane of chloroplasts 64 [Vitis vinifera]